MGVNTDNCSDMNGNQQFKCECKDGFVGERCEDSLCPLDCQNDGICKFEIDETNRTIWECACPFPFGGEKI